MKFALILLFLLPVSKMPAHQDAGEQGAGEAEELLPIIGLGHWRGHETHKVIKHVAGSMGPVESRLKSADKAAEVFSKEVFANLAKLVDFEKQDLLIVRFGGAGQNKLMCYVSLSKKPIKVLFTIGPGATKDLVDQIHVFAVRKDVELARDGYPGPFTGQ